MSRWVPTTVLERNRMQFAIYLKVTGRMSDHLDGKVFTPMILPARPPNEAPNYKWCDETDYPMGCG